ncbi:MAG: hypothetical protein R6V53_02350 [Candidatus Woesearchaeota archaeon]
MYDAILAFMQRKGPCVPMEVANHLKKDSFLASAMLSELVQSGKVRMTNFSVGRSRLYYLPEHEGKLEGYISYLNEKDQRTCEFLREKKVLRDKDQETLVRVSLRNIPDFAKPIEVTYNGEKHLFWKWFMVDDVEPLLKGFFDVKEDARDPGEKETPDDKAGESSYENSNAMEGKNPARSQVEESGKGLVDESQESGENQELGKSQARPGEYQDSVEKQDSTEKNQLKDTETQGSKAQESESPAQEKVENSRETVKDVKRLSDWAEDSDYNTGASEKKVNDGFAAEVVEFLSERGVVVKDHTVQRKNSDIDLDVVIQTRVGELPYHCKARKKKQVNDGDISSAFVAGQMKKLPVLFVTTGTLTKKAKEQLSKLPMTVVSMDGS